MAAYARVSSAKDAMHHSLSAQIAYYSKYIQSHPDWEYMGVYADEAKTGTKDSRENFQRLLSDCRDGTIDMVISKSVSRFARNTVTLLETVRELKRLGIDVYFEEQNIHTLSANGELMLSIMASFAQAESMSASENQKWRIKKNFEEGMPWNGTLFGYVYDNGIYKIVPKEAEIVRWIFQAYLEGMGTIAIVRHLNHSGIPTRKGNAWSANTVVKLLKNYAYTGNLLLQKTFRENYLSKKVRDNHGELPMYHAEGTHEAIIDMAIFQAVQTELARRSELYRRPQGSTSQFTGKLKCGCCGMNYRRKTARKRHAWICGTFNTMGKEYCPDSKSIPEDRLIALTDSIGGMECIESITVFSDNHLECHLRDGSLQTLTWENHSRRESWTADMREAARQRALERGTAV